MATTITTTNVGLSQLESAPGGGVGANTNVSFATSGRRGWNEGTLGAQTVFYYTWGYGSGGGGGYLDAIYGLNPPTTGSAPLSLNDWKGLQYYFDGSPFDIKYAWTNNLPNSPDDDVNVDIVITDSSLNYSIFGGPNTPPNYQFSLNMMGNANSGGSQTIPGFTPDVYPLVKNVYWIINFNMGPNFTGGTVNMDINGANVFSRGFGVGPIANDQYDYVGYSAGDTNASGILLEFYVN